MIIGVTGLIGYETAAKLCCENEELVKQRFPSFWLEKIQLSGQVNIDKLYENLYTMKMRDKIQGFWEIREGGLFGTLWKACTAVEKDAGINKTCGCRVYIKQVPILQEVVEICELFDVNPYEAPSKGAFLVFAEENKFDTNLKGLPGASNLTGESNLPGASNLTELLKIRIIGKTADTKERVLIMGQDEKTGEIWKRFLTPPARQAKDLENSIRK